MIVSNRKGTRLKAAAKWLIGIPLIVGLVVASASIPFISKSIQGCHISPPSSTVVRQLDIEGNTASWGPYLGLYIVPAYVVIIYTTGALLRVYLHVRKVNRNANKWRFPTLPRRPERRVAQNGSASDTAGRGRRRSTTSVNLQKELAIQSAMYLVALYLSWFVYLVIAVHLDKYLMSHYSLWAFVYFLIPLQGFLNSITYFRPRFVRLWAKYRKERLRKKQQESSDGAYGSKSDDSKGKGGWAASEPAADMEELQEGTATMSFQNKLDSSMEENDVEFRRVASSTAGVEEPQRESTTSSPASAARPLDQPLETA